MEWTKQPPTVPGWYWFRSFMHHDTPVHVVPNEHGHLFGRPSLRGRNYYALSMFSKYQGEWCGPVADATARLPRGHVAPGAIGQPPVAQTEGGGG